ncbi:MAG: hypothetical protein ACREEW_16290 [Caulobacteraceae bacterium]
MLDRLTHGASALVLAVACLAIAGAASAQTAGADAASYNAGYSRSTDQENLLAGAAATQDANGHAATVAGVIAMGQDQSGLGNSGVGGAVEGVGAAGSTPAFGSNLSVVTTPANGGVAAPFQTNPGALAAPSTPSEDVSHEQQ